MKKFLIVIVAATLLFLIIKLSIPKPDQSIPEATNQTAGTSQTQPTVPGEQAKGVNVAASDISIGFTGYGPGKQHDGTIKVKESSLVRTGSLFSGGVTIDMNSIASSPDKLNTDLKGSGFFDVAKYPTATFAITSATNTELKGNLTIKGVTKPVTLPLAFDAATSTYVSTVRINMELFGIKQTFADKEFVLKIAVK